MEVIDGIMDEAANRQKSVKRMKADMVQSNMILIATGVYWKPIHGILCNEDGCQNVALK